MIRRALLLFAFVFMLPACAGLGRAWAYAMTGYPPTVEWTVWRGVCAGICLAAAGLAAWAYKMEPE